MSVLPPPSGRRPGLWRRPAFWLLAQAIAVHLWMAAWRPLTPVVYPDTRTYRQALAGASLRDDLSQARTLGYPLFLAAVERLGGGAGAVLHAQLGLYLLAAVCFGLAAGVYLGSGWVGLAAATPLFYSRLAGDFAPALLSDLLAAAFALAAVACLLWLVALPPALRRWKAGAWLGLTAALAGAYHTRPAYVFLIAALPLMALSLARLTRPAGRRAALRLAAGLSSVAILPFLAWCGLRWVAAGHFGLVAFGGTNLTGITSSMLSAELKRELPKEHRRLGRGILAGRRARGLEVSGEYDYHRWCAEYNINVHEIARPAMLQIAGQPGRNSPGFDLFANRRFTALSLEVIRLRPGLYGRWLRDAMVGAAKSMAGSHLLRGIALVMVASLGVAAVLGRARERPAWARIAVIPGARAWGLLFAGLGYAALAALVVALVEWPLDRYVFAAELLLPSGLAALAADAWRRAPVPPPVP